MDFDQIIYMHKFKQFLENHIDTLLTSVYVWTCHDSVKYILANVLLKYIRQKRKPFVLVSYSKLVFSQLDKNEIIVETLDIFFKS